MSAKNSMKLWRCPKCKLEVEAIATEVSHKCNPKAMSSATIRFELVEGK